MTVEKGTPSTPFYFKEDKEVILSQMANEVPLNLRYLDNLIERVQKRYPLIDKVETALIIKEILKVMREIFITGEILHFYKIITLKLRVFWRRGRPNTQSIITTPPDLK